jgi:CelD/BcsL family acetyltransferase involved in cellulose biosynthesis
LTEAQKTAVRMRAEGYTVKAIAAILEVNPNTVYRWDAQAWAIASPFFAKPFGTSESPKGAKNGRRVMAFGAPAGPIANVALIATSPARPVRTQRGVRTPLADDSTPARDALLSETSDRRYRVDLRSHTRRVGFRGRLDSLAHSLHVSQREQ